MVSRPCSVEGCERPSAARGWCPAHYWRWRKHGDPTGGRATASGDLERYFQTVVLPYEGDKCLIWPYHNVKGYGRLDRKGQGFLVSRLVCEAEHGPPPSPQHQAAHSCGKGHLGCVAKRHLAWKTHTANQADRLTHGTHNRGERQGGAKLTRHDIVVIRALAGTVEQRKLACCFRISKAQISRVIHKKTWVWL